MIWFSCKKCGKVHSRPEGSGGTYVFCDCGLGMTVPWESTAEPQELPAAPSATPRDLGAPPPLPSRLEPIPIGEERVPPRARPVYDPYEPPARPRSSWEDRPRGRRRWGRRNRDPRYCFNHEEAASEKTCTACGEPFCADCLVELRGKTLCAPCKNFRIRLLHNPPRVSGMAITAVLIAMLSGPLAMCIWFIAVLFSAPIINLLGLLPQILALLLGVASMKDTETNPRISGRSLALTAVFTAVVAGSMSVLLTVFGARLA